MVIQSNNEKLKMGYRFEKLIVWQKAMEFCLEVYNKTKGFPKEELYGLTPQFRMASTSIPLNISEDSAYKSSKEFIQFLYFALRSQYEVVTIMKLGQRLKYIDSRSHEKLESAIAEIGKLLQGLINSLQKRSKNRQLKTNS